ncbi:alpha/beta hydrolase fold domain-containing protein [Ruthenibacterium lactatiformans]|uniref:alpha/beta hydrolase fold domain-containing protein n=1 Tax=Ruthenibacterium lactatiformans TaxID=1550024 RepID=UPI003522E6A6
MMGAIPCSHSPHLFSFPHKAPVDHAVRSLWHMAAGFESRTGCEGMHVAGFFARAGFNAAILTYRLKPYSRRDAMHDMQRAIRLLRARRDELGITDKIAVMGFSAGGMLSGKLCNALRRRGCSRFGPCGTFLLPP